MKLSFYINFILNLENVPVLNKHERLNIDGFDVGVLILDDIKDQSKIRNGQPCYYIIHGVDTAMSEAERLKKKAFNALSEVCRKRKIGFIKILRAKFLLNCLWKNIQKGQSIDLFLQTAKIIDQKLFDKYGLMIRLFTGKHIKYGFLLGYLISGKNPIYKNTVIDIGENIGLIRQIQDDLNDYEQKHHEPLGDLINHKKRLPELIFLLNASDNEKGKLNEILNTTKDVSDIKNFVLNEKTKKEIYSKIFTITQNIEEKLLSIPEKYQNELKNLLDKFLPRF